MPRRSAADCAVRGVPMNRKLRKKLKRGGKKRRGDAYMTGNNATSTAATGAATSPIAGCGHFPGGAVTTKIKILRGHTGSGPSSSNPNGKNGSSGMCGSHGATATAGTTTATGKTNSKSANNRTACQAAGLSKRKLRRLQRAGKLRHEYVRTEAGALGRVQLVTVPTGAGAGGAGAGALQLRVVHTLATLGDVPRSQQRKRAYRKLAEECARGCAGCAELLALGLVCLGTVGGDGG